MATSSQTPTSYLEYLRASWNQTWLFGLLLVAATFIAYQPAWYGKPIWDDAAHMTPPGLRSMTGLAHIWMQPGTTQQYYPLTYSVFWVEYQLWGDSTLGYHLVNILLHAAAALLVVRILQQLEVPGAWLAAGIFALHPVQVESVAWISELKNSLSGVFYLSSALAYLGFDRNRNGGNYALALGLFVLGLLSKTVIATLPAALLLIFWWKRGRLFWKQDARPLVPFFLTGIGTGLFTAWFERKVIHAEGQAFDFTFIERILIAGRALWFYLGKLCWPANLVFNYPRWDVSQVVWWQYLFPAAMLLLLAALWWVRRRWRGPLAGLLFFAGTLFPVLGFLNVYPFRYSFVADHFQYLAGISLLALAAAGITTALGLLGKRKPFWEPVLCGTLLLVLGLLTWRQCGMYADIETLWRVTIAKNPISWLAHNNLGYDLLQAGQVDEAIAHFQKAVKIQPQYSKAQVSLGVAFFQKGQVDEAIAQFQKALEMEIEPDAAEVHYDLAIALLQKGRVDEAIAQFQMALAIQPDDAATHNNLGNALFQKGRVDEAIAHFQKAIELHPELPNAHNNLGNVLLQKGRVDEAIIQYQKALEIQPVNAEFHHNLGYALFQKGQTDEAIAQLQEALEIRPDQPKACYNLARVAWELATSPEATVRNGAKAVALAGQVEQLSGGRDPVINMTLAAAYAETGRFPEAIETARRAQQLAAAQNKPSLVEAIQMQVGRYQAGAPFRDAGRTNTPTHPGSP